MTPLGFETIELRGNIWTLENKCRYTTVEASVDMMAIVTVTKHCLKA